MQSAEWSPELRGALKAAIQERHSRDFVHALVARRPFSATVPKAVRRSGAPDLLSLAAPALAVLCDDGVHASEAFLGKLHDVSRLPQRDRRRQTSTIVGEWLEHMELRAEPTDSELFASLIALLLFGEKLPARCFLPLWCRTFDGSQAFLEAPGAEIVTFEDFLRQIEIPWWIANVHGPLQPAHEYARHFDNGLKSQLASMTDDNGAPHARLIRDLPRILSSLVRCLVLDHLRDEPSLSKSTAARIANLVVRTTGLLDDSGRLPIASEAMDMLPILQTAVRLLGLSKATDTRRALAWFATGRDSQADQSGKRAATSRALRRLRSFHSDWAMTASLAADRKEFSSRAELRLHSNQPDLVLDVNGTRLLAGTWEAEIAIGGEPVKGPLEWTCSCWYSDADADFAELQCLVRPGVTLQRHLLIAKKQPWVLLADEVRAADATIDYSASLPLGPDWIAQEDTLTREWALRNPEHRVRVCPLFVPQEKVFPSEATWECREGQLRLKANGRSGLYLPVVFEWDRGNRKAGVDWNALTVADSGRVLERAEASAYRLRIGEQQSVVYHSQTRAHVGRSFLGHHSLYETVIGNFAAGTLDPLVQVEFGKSS